LIGNISKIDANSAIIADVTTVIPKKSVSPLYKINIQMNKHFKKEKHYLISFNTTGFLILITFRQEKQPILKRVGYI